MDTKNLDDPDRRFLDNETSSVDSAGSDSDSSPYGSTHPSFALLKWQRLRKDYNDQYLELFQAVQAEGDDAWGKGNKWKSSQLGAVMWSVNEKLKALQCVARLGKHDLPGIAAQIGTKSELEVKDYLDHLEQALIDRQLFHRQTNNLTYADIPAAVEIGSRCEKQLEKAADALSAFQDQYDHAVGEQQSDLPWLITDDIAAELDRKSDEDESKLTPDDEPQSDDESDAYEPFKIFHLSKFLELSQRFFMVNGVNDSYENWFDVAEDGELPSMTSEYVEQIYDLLQNLLRRLIQTCLFLAQSRIRATTRVDHRPSNCVKVEDIEAALDILNMAQDSWNFWVKVPRKHGLRVVLGSHSRGASDKEILDFDQIEAALLERPPRGRRQSLSVTPITSTGSEVSSNQEETQELNGKNAVESNELSSESLTESNYSDHPNDEESVSGHPDLDESGIGTTHSTTPKSSAKRRKMSDIDEDIYLKELDKIARLQEEARLCEILGLESRPVDESSPIQRPRPRALRKNADEIRRWNSRYITEWEHLESRAQEDASARSAVQRKKRRVSASQTSENEDANST